MEEQHQPINQSNNNESNNASVNEAQLPSVFSLYNQSWNALKISFVTVVKLALRPFIAILPALIGMIMNGMNSSAFEKNTFLDVLISGIMILSLLAFIYFIFRIASAVAYVQLEAVKGNKISDKTALENTKSVAADYVLVSLLTGLIILGGFILLIVPGLFMMRRYVLAGYHLIDKKLGVREAMKESLESSKKYASAHWGLVGLQAVINLISYVPLFGPIISLVMSVMYFNAPAIRYQQIKNLP